MMNRILILTFFTLIFNLKSKAQINAQIYTDVEFLANDKLEGRSTGTKGEKAAADYLAKRFKEIGLTPRGTNGYFQDFTFKPKTHPHGKVNYTDSIGQKTITGRNVIGFINNHAPYTIVIGAHYDH